MVLKMVPPQKKKNFLDDDDPIDEDIKLKYIKSLYLHAINYLPPSLFKPEVAQLHKLLLTVRTHCWWFIFKSMAFFERK